MDVVFYTLKSRCDDLDISVLKVIPDGRSVAVLQLAHGMCGSKERFLPFMKYMAGRGVACYANDHRGHGQSVRKDEDLGYMYGAGEEGIVDDMKLLSDHIKEEYEGLPLFLLGHSMGSMAVRACLKKYPEIIDGVILCGSPGYSPAAPLGYALSSFLCRCGLGRIRAGIIQNHTSRMCNRPFASEGYQAWTCSDPAVRKSFAGNPRHNFIMTFDGSKALLGLMLQAYSSETKKKADDGLPILFLSGEEDPCMGGTAGLGKAVAVMRESGYRRISVKIYPAMRHEVLNEIGKERVWRDIIYFMGLWPICKP